MNEKVILELNLEQAWNIARACEFYGRVRNGQFSEITWELLLNKHKQAVKFDKDLVDSILMAARKPIFPELSLSIGHHYGVNHDHDADVAFDIYEVIRNKIEYYKESVSKYPVECKTPMNWSGLPLPKCRIEEG